MSIFPIKTRIQKKSNQLQKSDSYIASPLLKILITRFADRHFDNSPQSCSQSLAITKNLKSHRKKTLITASPFYIMSFASLNISQTKLCPILIYILHNRVYTPQIFYCRKVIKKSNKRIVSIPTRNTKMRIRIKSTGCALILCIYIYIYEFAIKIKLG